MTNIKRTYSDSLSLNTMQRILVIGACGQIGTELTIALRGIHGDENVVATDVREPELSFKQQGPFETLDVLNADQLSEIIDRYGVTEIYHLAALLSATAEKDPIFGWELNMGGLLNVLETAVAKKITKVFWPSSIAAFGPTTPRLDTPQDTVMDPDTVYGISKLAGERWVEYYWKKYDLDVRSVRYPGLISYGAPPGGGTTDYAVEIFYEALKGNNYTSFLKEDARLPMMYMPDAIRGTIELMQAPADAIQVRSSYNFASMSFTPAEIAAEIKKHHPDFDVDYEPDYRQTISESWPASIDDAVAREQWGWSHTYDLEKMTVDMLANVKIADLAD
jgi:nucleoside-diphosphate-sugar epimerase